MSEVKRYYAKIPGESHDWLMVFATDYDALHAEAEALRAENERLRSLINTPHTDEWIAAVRLEAAYQIERWDGFPPTGKFWEGSGEPMSYSACYGSNGERDHMRNVAAEALAAHRQAQQGEQP